MPKGRALDVLFPHAKRIKTVKMVFSPEQIPTAEACLAAFGTKVTDLCLFAAHRSPNYADGRAGRRVSVKASQLPDMTHLQLYGVAVDVPTSMWSKLSSLDVRDVSDFGLFQTLSACNTLQYLVLVNTSSPFEVEEPQHIASARLPG